MKYNEADYLWYERCASERINHPELFPDENVYETIGRLMVWLASHDHLNPKEATA